MATISLMCSMCSHDAGHFGDQFIALGGQEFGSLGEIFGEQFALGIGGQKLRELAVLAVQHGGGAAEIADLGLAQPVTHHRGGHTHAVEHIADVVEHAGGDLGHAGLPGDLEQLLVGLFQFGLRFDAFVDFPLQIAASARAPVAQCSR